jgi:hypothetical protein
MHFLFPRLMTYSDDYDFLEEDGILHSHRRENLKSYIRLSCFYRHTWHRRSLGGYP